jgi:hypothetical protein
VCGGGGGLCQRGVSWLSTPLACHWQWRRPHRGGGHHPSHALEKSLLRSSLPAAADLGHAPVMSSASIVGSGPTLAFCVTMAVVRVRPAIRLDGRQAHKLRLLAAMAQATGLCAALAPVEGHRPCPLSRGILTVLPSRAIPWRGRCPTIRTWSTVGSNRTRGIGIVLPSEGGAGCSNSRNPWYPPSPEFLDERGRPALSRNLKWT